jgi:8-oxo-dGTP diphosphatase
MIATTGDRLVLHVAAGVLQDQAGRVLIARRPDGAHMGGAWEFPGGKIDPGETQLQGLVRELREELGISARYVRHLVHYFHDYPDRRVYLYVWKVLDWRAAPSGVEGQSLQWVEPAGLMQAGLLSADKRIAALLMENSAVNKLRPLQLGPN